LDCVALDKIGLDITHQIVDRGEAAGADYVDVDICGSPALTHPSNLRETARVML
jgi:hypothetical protein